VNSVILVDRRARIVFPSDSPTAYTDLANEVDRLNAENERLKDERDAAVARNIHLHTRVEEERALRVPVADIVLGVLRILDTAKTVDDIRAAVEDIPGWDGTEGGYYPGCQTSHFIARDVYDKDLAALRVEAPRRYVELARAVGVDGTDHPHALAAARAAVIDANAWAEGHPMLKQMVAEVERLNAKDAALTAEVLDLRAKLSQMADDAVKVMAKSLRDVEEMREHITARDVHCPGTDSDCPRACTTNLCEIMVAREKA